LADKRTNAFSITTSEIACKSKNLSWWHYRGFDFDSAEGESELVSGFNIESGAGGFTLIFLAEYASILFMRLLFCVIFWGVIWIL
jgi:formate hydrogenlyase subunit 4